MQAIDIIIIAVVVVLMGFGAYKMWLQLSGRKTCCGGTKEIVKTKKLKNIIGTKVVHIDGMHCDHCKSSVTKALNALDGVSAKVVLAKNMAIVSFEHEVLDSEIIEAVESKGFEVTKIEK